MPALILLAVWKNFGYATVIFLAGLQNVPEELYEAARIDGAGPVRQFRHVTLPELGPTFVFVGVITAIGFLQVFAEPYVMTPDGGPLNAHAHDRDAHVSRRVPLVEHGLRRGRRVRALRAGARSARSLQQLDAGGRGEAC